jgi:hypothetical protein
MIKHTWFIHSNATVVKDEAYLEIGWKWKYDSS